MEILLNIFASMNSIDNIFSPIYSSHVKKTGL
jgi:hypothetical protein